MEAALAIKIGDQKISNSYRGMRFTIRPRDIENGQPNDPCGCAAALALRREADAKLAYVYRDVTYIHRKDNTVLRYKTTPALRLETIVFDRNGEFVPGEYLLDAAPLVDKTKAKKSNGSAPVQRSNKKRRERYSIPNVRPTASQKLPGA
jgi:hypothetical protein